MKYNSEKAVVYIFKCGEFYKIGWATDYKRRCKELQVGNPFEIERYAYKPFDSKRKAQKWEGKLHRQHKDKHFRGEWYRFSKEEIEEAFPLIEEDE